MYFLCEVKLLNVAIDHLNCKMTKIIFYVYIYVYICVNEFIHT